MAIVGTAVGELRVRRGFTVREVASFIGIRQKRMRGIEHGTEDLNIEQLVVLARMLGVTAATMVQGIEPVRLDSPPAHGHGEKRPQAVYADAELDDVATVAQRFGASFRAYRRANVKRPLDRVARDAGVPHSTVASIERGRLNPRASLAVLLADASGVSLSRLFGDAGL